MYCTRHHFGQVFRVDGFDQVMDVIAHDAESIEFELILALALGNGIEQDLAAFRSRQTEFAIIAASCDVVTVARLQVAGHRVEAALQAQAIGLPVHSPFDSCRL